MYITHRLVILPTAQSTLKSPIGTNFTRYQHPNDIPPILGLTDNNST